MTSVEGVSLWIEEVEKCCCCWSVRLWYESWASIVVFVVVAAVDKVGITARSGILVVVVVVEMDMDPVGVSAYAWTARF